MTFLRRTLKPIRRAQFDPPPRAPKNDRPGFPFGFLGAGGRLPEARRGRVLCSIHHHRTLHRATLRWPAGFLVLVGACQFGTTWAGLRLKAFIHKFIIVLGAGEGR